MVQTTKIALLSGHGIHPIPLLSRVKHICIYKYILLCVLYRHFSEPFEWRDSQGQTQSPRLAELVALTLSSTLRSRNSSAMTEFRVECLTYAHSRARPVLSLTSPGYGLPPTVTTYPPGVSIYGSIMAGIALQTALEALKNLFDSVFIDFDL